MPRISLSSKSKKLINLLPNDEFESSTFGKILKWGLSTFRAMVIVTELIVVSAFLSRFYLDSRNSDLNQEIAVYKAQVLAYSDIESIFRNSQTKLSVAKSIYQSPKLSNIILEINKSMPPDVTLNSISIVDNVLQIKATSFSERSITQFLVNMENNQNFTDVNLTQISSATDDSLATIFNIGAKMKGVVATTTK